MADYVKRFDLDIKDALASVQTMMKKLNELSKGIDDAGKAAVGGELRQSVLELQRAMTARHEAAVQLGKEIGLETDKDVKLLESVIKKSEELAKKESELNGKALLQGVAEIAKQKEEARKQELKSATEYQKYLEQEAKLQQQQAKDYQKWWTDALRDVDAKRAESRRQEEAWRKLDSQTQKESLADLEYEGRIQEKNAKDYEKWWLGALKSVESQRDEMYRQAKAWAQYDEDNTKSYMADLEYEGRMNEEEFRRQAAAWKEYMDDLEAEGKRVQTISDNMVSAMQRAAQRIVQLFRQAFNEAIQYVEEFDKALTSIAIVTGDAGSKSMLGERYESIAKEMKVTSIEIATAAEELYRQGITDAGEVEDRLKTITEFAKISGLSFSESVEAITASINNFTAEGESGAEVAERIVDVWSYLGDATATGADEIGTAMQKVAASGQAAGVTLEKLSSYIAVIEAKTRLAAESVGTTLNSIMARYMKVTTKGFGASVTTDEGDVVSINDIAKALDTVGIAVYNTQTGFMDFEDVLDRLGPIWKTLSDNQRNYIATQIAGTRGLNMFLALMNGYDDALNLTAEAMNSAGTAAEKYAIWQDGLEASANGLSAALNDLYSDIVSANEINVFYKIMTGLVEAFDKATESIGGFNVKLALIAAGGMAAYKVILSIVKSITALGGMKGVFIALTGAITGTTTAAKGLNLALSASVVGVAVLAVTSLVGAFVSLHETEEEAAERYSEINESLRDGANKADNMTSSIEALKASVENGTISESEYLAARKSLLEQFPNYQGMLEDEKNAIDDLKGSYEELINAMGQERLNVLMSNFLNATTDFDEFSANYDRIYNEITSRVVSLSKGLYSDLINNNVGSDVVAQMLRNAMENVNLQGQLEYGSITESFSRKGYADMKAVYDNLKKEFDKYNNGEDSAFTINPVFKEFDMGVVKQYLADLKYWLSEERGRLENEAVQFVSGIVTASLDPNKYSQIADKIPTIIDVFAGFDSVMEGGSEGLKESVTEYADALVAAFGDEGLINKIEAALPETGIADAVANALFDPDNVFFADYIVNGLSALFDSYKTTGGEAEFASIKDYLLYNLGIAIGNDGKVIVESPTDVSSAGDSAGDEIDKEADSLYKRAKASIDRLELLKKAQEEIDSTGTLSDSTKLGIAKEYDDKQVVKLTGDTQELTEAVKDLYDTEIADGQEARDMYGLTLDAEQDLIDIMNARIKASDNVGKAINKLRKNENLSKDEVDDLLKTYPQLIDDLYSYAKGITNASDLISALNKAQSDANFDTLRDNVNKALDALENYKEGTREYQAELENIGNILTGGIGDLTGMDFAVKYLDDIRAAADGSEAALRRLQAAAVINIVGSSNVDFSDVENGLIYVMNAAGATLDQLKQLGLFDIETVKLTSSYYTFDTKVNSSKINGTKFGMAAMEIPNIDVKPVEHKVASYQQILKMKGQSLKKPSTSGGSKSGGGGGGSGGSGGSGGGGRSGGGGGGSSSSSDGVSEAVQNKLDELKDITNIIDRRLQIAEAWEDFYNQTGELKKTIPYMQEQIDLYTEMIGKYQTARGELEPMTKDYKDQVDQLEAQVKSLEQLRDAYVEGSSKYKSYQKQIDAVNEELEQARTDYEALYGQVDEFTLGEIEAKKAIVELSQAIKEQRAAIRGLVADMKNTVLGYIESIEDMNQASIDATISMQDTILDILKSEAEEELDLEEEKADKKKELLQEQLDALRKNYDDARALADKQEKNDELSEKQRQLSLLSADPTKVKERMALEQEIAEMQKDMAWDAADEEIAAQEDALQKQIDGLDELVEANREAFDKVSGYSEEIVQQMYDIMSKSDEEIIAWLKDHSDEYADATKEARGELEKGWQETLDEISKTIRTKWNEVDEIIAGGLDSVIAKLKETSDFISSNLEDQVNTVEEVTKNWEDMTNAQKELTDAEKAGNYKSAVELENPEVTPGVTPEVTPKENTGSSVSAKLNGNYNIRQSYSKSSESLGVIPKGTKVTITGYHGDWYKTGYKGKSGWVYKDAFSGIDKSKLKKYRHGGVIDYTGPAWVDGTPQNPEYMFNSDQFKNLIMALDHGWQLPGMSEHDDNGGMVVEDGAITINVATLDKDADYEEVAKRVMDEIYRKYRIKR